MNQIYYGDNLFVLREHIRDESVDLIYLDPPFSSNRSYTVPSIDSTNTSSEDQIMVFDDTWHWDISSEAALGKLESGDERASRVFGVLRATLSFLGKNDMAAYLVMMAERLLELHRVLDATGSIYLHCDTTASHYLKIMMDTIFGVENYRNEISWRRSNPKSHATLNFPNCRDVILRYSKTENAVFHQLYTGHDPEYIAKAYRYVDPDGRRYRLLPLLNPNSDRPNLNYEFLGVRRVWRWTRERMEKAYKEGLVVQLRPGAVPQYKKYLDESKGRTVVDDWDDIGQTSGKESLGYPTQKPLELLERIILASSNPGDTVLDPFCGCGTTIAAAEKLGRNWTGIDITQFSIVLVRQRLSSMYGARCVYEVIGEPTDWLSAQALAQENYSQFIWWALGLIGSRPVSERERGEYSGIDGILFFQDTLKSAQKKIIVRVTDEVTAEMLENMCGLLDSENAAMCFIITLTPLDEALLDETKLNILYHSNTWNRDYPIVQVKSVEDLLSGERFDYPAANSTSLHAEYAAEEINQDTLF